MENEAALFIPVEKKSIDKAFEYLAEKGHDRIYFYTNSSIGKLSDLSVDHVYFKLKGEKVVSLRSDFIELVTENPSDRRLPAAKYYYAYRNLQWLDQPIELPNIKYFKSGKALRNDVPGACIVLDPLSNK
jgi:hypothetical protein